MFGYTIIYTEDVAAMLEFYERAFGFTRRLLTDDHSYGELATGNTVLAFAHHTLGASNLPQGYRPVSDAVPAGIELGIVLEDVHTGYQTALAHGATAIVAPKQKPWGQTVGYVRDPAGTLLELCSLLPLPDDDPASVAQAWITRVWNGYDAQAITELHTPDFVDHSAAGRGTDLTAYAAGLADFYAAFPDFTTTAESIIADRVRNEVAIRWRATGTHTGAFFGSAPTGRRIDFEGIEILLVRQGRVAARWGEWNEAAIQAQIA